MERGGYCCSPRCQVKLSRRRETKQIAEKLSRAPHRHYSIQPPHRHVPLHTGTRKYFRTLKVNPCFDSTLMSAVKRPGLRV